MERCAAPRPRTPLRAPAPTRTPSSPSTSQGTRPGVAGQDHHDRHALSAPTSLTALATPTNQRPQLSWVAPVDPGFLLDHYQVYRNGVAPRERARHDVHRQHAGLGDSTYTYQVGRGPRRCPQRRRVGAGQAVLYDTTAPATPPGVAASAALDGSVTRQLVGLERRGLGRRPLRRAPLAVVDAAGVRRRRRRDLPGHVDCVHRRDDAERQALHLCGVRNRPRGQHVAGRRLGGR